jgi:hypothetical protein
MEVLINPDVWALIAWLAGGFVIGGTIMAGILYLAEFMGWMF